MAAAIAGDLLLTGTVFCNICDAAERAAFCHLRRRADLQMLLCGLVDPRLTKRSLMKAGENPPKTRTSGRKVNKA